jgi:hypothetical protein
MKLRSPLEFENTVAKLRNLEESYDSALEEQTDDDELRQAELESLKRLINQFKEEITRYEAHQ